VRKRHEAFVTDLLYLGALVLLIGIVVWQRARFDLWINRHDNLTAYFPWWSYLGDRLAAGEIPGWNPYRFSGTPFLADPQSGWMYLPTMLTFAIFEPITAIKVRLAVHLLIASFSTYALARIYGYRALAAFAAATLMAFGPLVYQVTYCCNVREQILPWVPVVLIGAEIAIRPGLWAGRIAGITLAGFGYSQMLAGWLGQGSLNAALLIGAYCLYRALTVKFGASPGRRLAAVGRRFAIGAGLAAAIGLFGAALNAVALLPRLAVNAETTVGSGNYNDLIGYTASSYGVRGLVAEILYTGNQHRVMTIPIVGMLLLLLALTFVPRAHPVPFFAGMTLITLMLATSGSPIYWFFSLIPRWKELHDHFPPQVTANLMIGPCMLAAAAMDALIEHRPRRLTVARVVGPLAIILLAALWIERGHVQRGDETLILPAVFAVIGAGVILLALSARASDRLRSSLLVTVALLIFVEPMGLELLETETGWNLAHGLKQNNARPFVEQAARVFSSPTDPGGAGEYLQRRMAEEGPFRFISYAGAGHLDDDRSTFDTRRRLEPGMFAILANSRSMFLGLYDTQGYNPVQLARYTNFMTALNGERQDYHRANVRWPGGVDSPLLNILNVRFILVHGKIPPDRDDVVALTQDRPLVFENELVRIYENLDAQPHAWIVHDIRTASQQEAMVLLNEGTVDLTVTALVEGTSPPADLPPRNAVEQVTLTRYEPEHVSFEVTASADGLLVVSDVYSAGWSAYVDGRPVDILPTDVALRGVPVTAGVHIVEMRYQAPLFRIGAALSLVAHVLLLASIGWWLGSRRPDCGAPEHLTRPGNA
jgi:hypothetical protein